MRSKKLFHGKLVSVLFIIVLVLFVTLSSCMIFNSPPLTPSDPLPKDGDTGVSLTPRLMWHSEDPEGDKMTFDLYLDTKNPPQELKGKGLSENEYYVKDKLSPGTKYYWQVMVKDSKGNLAKGSIWSFTTSAPPKIPYAPQPADESTNVSLNTKLSWSCDDPDDDILAYDLYIGTSTPLTLQATYIISHDYYPPIFSPGTRYYWKVVAKDVDGNIVEGPMWNFTTSHAPEITLNFPEDKSNGESTNLALNWNSTDPDGDAISYKVYFGRNYPPPLYKVNFTQSSLHFDRLYENTEYFWQIAAQDGKGNIVKSPIRTFRTIEGDPLTFSDMNVIGDTGEVFNYISKIFIQGEYAYIGTQDGLDIVDISDLSSPVVVSHINAISGEIHDIFVSGDYAYVTDWEKLLIVDISDPKNPNIISNVQVGYGHTYSIYVFGDYAVAFTGRVVVLNISDLRNPKIVGYVDTPECNDYSCRIFAYGNYVYLVEGNNELVIIDVSIPSNSKIVRIVKIQGSAQDVYVSNGYAYVAADSYFDVVDVNDPENAEEVKSIKMSGAERVFVAEGYAFVATSSSLMIYNVDSNPEEPSLVKNVDDIYASSIYVAGYYLFVGEGYRFFIVDLR